MKMKYNTMYRKFRLERKSERKEGRLYCVDIMPSYSYSSIWIYFLSFFQLLIGISSTAYMQWLNMLVISLNSKGLLWHLLQLLAEIRLLVLPFSWFHVLLTHFLQGQSFPPLTAASNSSHLTEQVYLNEVYLYWCLETLSYPDLFHILRKVPPVVCLILAALHFLCIPP